jgi:hypothetical protein
MQHFSQERHERTNSCCEKTCRSMQDFFLEQRADSQYPALTKTALENWNNAALPGLHW